MDANILCRVGGRQLETWPDTESCSKWHNALHRRGKSEVVHPPEGTNYMTTIEFRTADGVIYGNPALPLQKIDQRNFLLQKANNWEVVFSSHNHRNCKTSWYHHLFGKDQNIYYHWAYSPNGRKSVKCQRKKEMQIPRSCSWMRK